MEKPRSESSEPPADWDGTWWFAIIDRYTGGPHPWGYVIREGSESQITEVLAAQYVIEARVMGFEVEWWDRGQAFKLVPQQNTSGLESFIRIGRFQVDHSTLNDT